MSVNIAIVDNGIRSELLKNPMNYNMEITEDKSCKNFLYDFEEQLFFHGTDCALIIEKYCPEADLTGIKILDNNGKGILDKLEPALEWCFQKGIILINLSLGTTHFQDRNKIRQIINHYVNKGMIFIAATANNGYKTYPASFSNVIGVASGDEFDINTNLFYHNGVDLIAPSNHEIMVKENSFTLKNSNSYAAPYITAKVCHLMSDNQKYGICDLKNRLFMLKNRHFTAYYPDWIEKAWIPSQSRISNAPYYFLEVTGQHQDCIAQADTIVLSNRDEYAIYGEVGKHIVYLGEEPIECLHTNVFFWSREQRKEQITKCEKRVENIDIPCVVCRFEKAQDEILLLGMLKMYFARDGYNAYTISHRVESVLYDLEYIPKELCNENNIEAVYDFLYWQTYYEQSDIVIWAFESNNYFRKMNDMVDILVDFTNIKAGVQAEIYCDGIIKRKMIIKSIDEEIKTLYKFILTLLKEENSE